MDLVNHLEGRLLFAIPKKGRLNQATLNLLEGSDIQFKRENRLDIALVKNLPIALLFLPAADIPTFVGEGRCDLGITGLDQVHEHDANVRAVTRARRLSGDIKPEEIDGRIPGCDVIMELGFGSCKLQVQVPEKSAYKTSKDLVGKNIGTSFVRLTEEHFARLEHEEDEQNGIRSGGKLRTKIIDLSGSVEAACALGVADGIVDLVESGETMRACGLHAIDTVMGSTAILIKSRSPSNPELLDLITSRIKGVITAQKYVLCQYNVERSRLHDATKITPGKRSATVTTLDEEGWCAVSAMVEKKQIAVVMDRLEKLGASDILVLHIGNSRNT